MAIIYTHPTPTQTSEAKLAARSGQAVISCTPLDPALYDRHEVGPMFAVTFADGFVGHVFADELSGS